MNIISSYSKPYLTLSYSKEDFGINYGLILLLNNCKTKEEFISTYKFHINGIFMSDISKEKITIR